MLRYFSLWLIFYCCVTIIFSSCNETRFLQSEAPVTISPAIETIVDGIAKYNELTGSAVGEPGVKTIQWVRYEKLSKTASAEELRALTDHQNGVVRCYAYTALIERKDPDTFPILLSHLSDTATVSTFFGCLQSQEKVGDYFLNQVTSGYVEDTAYRLSAKQQSIVDSILLFDKRITLNAKYSLLEKLKPLPQYYNRVKEFAVNENQPVAIWTLARYRKQSDIGIIKAAFNSPKTENYAIRSAIAMPDSSFYPALTQIFEREWKEKSYDYQKWRLLYMALAKYPLQPQTLTLFKRTVQTKDKFRYKTLCADALIAITKYPNPIFEPIKNQIKLDEYEMSEVRDALKEID